MEKQIVSSYFFSWISLIFDIFWFYFAVWWFFYYVAVYTPQFGLDWPLGEKELHFLRTNLGTLIEMLDTEGDLLGWLLSMKVINAKQMEHIKKKPTSFDCNEAFLEILNQSSLKAYHLTTICLRESNQVSVSELFENGGGMLYKEREDKWKLRLVLVNYILWPMSTIVKGW